MSSIYDYQGNEVVVTENYEPRNLDIPVVSLSGTLPADKSQGEINVVLEYKSATDSFTDYATAKVQGDSSASYPKKNFTIKLFSDSERTKKDKRVFKDWVKANKYVLKANWIDHSHARNIVNARLWTQIVKSRADFDTLPSALTESHIAIDGFPVKVYNNGVYMGIYTWNTPKSALYGLDDDLAGNCLVQGDAYTDSTKWRVASMNGWSDETHDSMPSLISTSFVALINFVLTSSDADFVSNFSMYFDKQSIIDQYIFLNSALIIDNLGKNQAFFTYDSTYWYGGMYDMDGTWGLPPWQVEQSGWQSASTVLNSEGTTNLLYERVASLFASDIKTRYAELRGGILSADNIASEFDRFMSVIPPYLYEEDYASTTGGGAFTNIPMKTTNNILQIRQFITDRLAAVDTQINAL